MINGTDLEELRQWHRINGRHRFPWRHEPSPWSVLVAETLLHRTKASKVAELYSDLITRFPAPSKVVGDQALWLRMTAPLGLTWRSATFIEACEVLIRKFNSSVPSERSSLLTLPGVGHYVADAVLCFGFNQPSVLVDTNTIRLASRISGVQLDPRKHRSKGVHDGVRGALAIAGTPRACGNYALLDLAAMVCLLNTPLCEKCPLNKCCRTAAREYVLYEGSTVSKGDEVEGSQR